MLSLVVPAYNEGPAVAGVLRSLRAALDRLPIPSELVVVDDGSKDDTAAQVEGSGVRGVRLVRNPVNLGYGHSLLRGIAAARGTLIGITDADGTYPSEALVELYDMVARGADQAIGQRTGRHFQRLWSPRHVYRLLCRYVVGQHVPDANSGLRLFRREVVEGLRGDLCLGFSFTTSLTLASIMSGDVVTFTPIEYHKRIGKSHVRFRDVLRTIQYLFQLIALYNPLKLFLPLVAAAGALALASFGYGLWLERIAGMVSGVVMTATTLLLVGLAGFTYTQTRIGLYPVVTRGGLEAAGRPARDRSRSFPPRAAGPAGAAPAGAPAVPAIGAPAATAGS